MRKQQKLLHDRKGGEAPLAILLFDGSQRASELNEKVGVDLDDHGLIIPNDILDAPSSDARDSIALLRRRFFIVGRRLLA